MSVEGSQEETAWEEAAQNEFWRLSVKGPRALFIGNFVKLV